MTVRKINKYIKLKKKKRNKENPTKQHIYERLMNTIP